MLQKSRKQLTSKLFVIESPDKEDGRCEILHPLKEIRGCEETEEVDVDKWFSADCEGEKQLSDQEAFSSILARLRSKFFAIDVE